MLPSHNTWRRGVGENEQPSLMQPSQCLPMPRAARARMFPGSGETRRGLADATVPLVHARARPAPLARPHTRLAKPHPHGSAN